VQIQPAAAVGRMAIPYAAMSSRPFFQGSRLVLLCLLNRSMPPRRNEMPHCLGRSVLRRASADKERCGTPHRLIGARRCAHTRPASRQSNQGRPPGHARSRRSSAIAHKRVDAPQAQMRTSAPLTAATAPWSGRAPIHRSPLPARAAI
jgi:hypothetical protein